MRIRLLASFLLLALTSSAQAAVCEPSFGPPIVRCADSPDQCPTLGATQMDGDKQNIIACVLDGVGGQKWKTMTVNSINCSSSQVMIGMQNGVPQCASLASLTASQTTTSTTTPTTTPTTTTPTTPPPTTTKIYGPTAGGYTAFVNASQVFQYCKVANPYTGGCSCPAGYAPTRTLVNDVMGMSCRNYLCGFDWLYQCY